MSFGLPPSWRELTLACRRERGFVLLQAAHYASAARLHAGAMSFDVTLTRARGCFDLVLDCPSKLRAGLRKLAFVLLQALLHAPFSRPHARTMLFDVVPARTGKRVERRKGLFASRRKLGPMFLDTSAHGTAARFYTRAVFFEISLTGFRTRLCVSRRCN